MLFRHTRHCQQVSIIPAAVVRPNSQLVAVEQRSRQSCLNVLHSFRLELILGLEFFRRLIAQEISTLTPQDHFNNLEPANDLRTSSTCIPSNVSNSSTTTSLAATKHSRSSLTLRHTRLNSLDLSRPETGCSPLVLRPGYARRAHGRLEVIDGRRDARSAFPRCGSCAG